MNFPEELKYTKSDEWVKFEDETTMLIGLTDYAQDQLGDLVYINLPMEGDPTTAGEAFCDVESVKAVADVICPCTGEITAVNEELLDAPQLLNEDCYGAWIARISDITYVEDLLTAEEYKAYREIK